MKLTFLGTGPDQAIPRPGCRCLSCREARRRNSKTRRTRSSLLIQTKQGNLLIDCSPDFLSQIKKTGISKIDAVFLTHRHQDAAGGLKLLNKWTKQPVTIFTEKINFNFFITHQGASFLSNFVTFSPFRRSPAGGQPIKPFQKIKIFDLIIQPFKVSHGLRSIPTLGYLINNQIIYGSDFGDLPAKSQRLLKNKPMAIFDAALWFGKKMKGHLNLTQTIAWAQKLKIKKLYLTQVGHGYPPYSIAQRQINQFLKKEYPQTKMSVKLAFDGMKIEL